MPIKFPGIKQVASVKKTAKKPSAAKVDNSPYCHQEKKAGLSFDLRCRIPWTEKQKNFLEIVQSKETKLVFVKGPAGVGKSLLAIYAGLLSIQEKKTSNLVYVRSLVESSARSMGFLKGDIEGKMLPFMEAGLEKVEELCGKENTKNLIEKGIFEMKPLNFLRGCQFSGKFVVFDEAQCATHEEALTFLSRIGEFSKVIVMGDPMQSDIGKKSSFSAIYELFNDEEAERNGVFTFEFDESDIMRSKLLRFIVKRFKEIQ